MSSTWPVGSARRARWESLIQTALDCNLCFDFVYVAVLEIVELRRFFGEEDDRSGDVAGDKRGRDDGDDRDRQRDEQTGLRGLLEGAFKLIETRFALQ